jgi:L-lactate dehydrogenase complex protein LldF
MNPTTRDFKAKARAALNDANLARALAGLPGGLVAQRSAAKARLPEFETLREVARDIRDHTLANLDHYLLAFEERATAAGTRVHWARTAREAQDIILGICQAAGARLVAKGKSMVSEEIGLNGRLEEAGIEVVETDLGEYLVQIRGEAPSHIIAPAIHLSEEQVAADFRRHHTHLPLDRRLDEPAEMVAEARGVLRQKFLAADIGITGANFLVAETGSAVIVTNEGNGDLTALLPKVHIVVASLEKVVPTLEDTALLLRLLARSGTGQDITAYTSFLTGPRREGDADGPEACHVVIVDNGRSELLASEFREVLRCIRCGACMNHCPVYNAIGGHAYGSVYAGPIGAVLTPALEGIRDTRDLPNASSFCGRCEEVCPVKIPLPELMRRWRQADFAGGGGSITERLALKVWAFCARRPGLYRALMRFGVAALASLGRGRGAFRNLPLAGGWTRHRDFPVPQGRTFQDLWNISRKREAK